MHSNARSLWQRRCALACFRLVKFCSSGCRGARSPRSVATRPAVDQTVLEHLLEVLGHGLLDGPIGQCQLVSAAAVVECQRVTHVAVDELRVSPATGATAFTITLGVVILGNG